MDHPAGSSRKLYGRRGECKLLDGLLEQVRGGHSMVLEDPATGEITAHWEPFSYALDKWWACEPGTVICPQCRLASDLNRWHWTGNWRSVVLHAASPGWRRSSRTR